MTEHAEMASISCATLPVQHRAHRTAAARADDEEVGALLLRDPLERQAPLHAQFRLTPDLGPLP